jgi:hypothetical protein
MAQKIKKVSIPEPCHEDWDKMTNTEKGKFCGLCQKEVHDISSFSDKKLVDFLERNDNACVQMLPSQTERNLMPEKRSPLLSRAAVALGLISLSATGNALSQRKTMGAVAYQKDPKIECSNDSIKKLQGEVVDTEDHKKMVELELVGIVQDSKRNGINEATITVNGGKKFNSNKLGKFDFKVKVPEGAKIELYVDRSGYMSEYIYVDPKNTSDIKIVLNHRMVKGKIKAH